jgi:hypothetical protein
MNKSAIAITSLDNSAQAGKQIGTEIKQKLGGLKPHAVLVFCSSRYDYKQVLEAIHEACEPAHLVGCSSAGEFTNLGQKEGSISAIGLWSDEFKFSSGVGRELRSDQNKAAEDLISNFKGIANNDYRFHTAIVMADALVGYTEDLIKALTIKTLGKYQLAGGGAGDDAKFAQTHVFYGTEPVKDAAVALEILSNEPIGVGIKHGWEIASPPLRVTEAQENRIFSLNGSPAIEVFQEHAKATGQKFDSENPVTFFLHNVLGIETPAGYKLRCPLALNADGSISCASSVPTGSIVHIMRTTTSSAADAAVFATRVALDQLEGRKPSVGIFFDCAATRLRLGIDFGLEIESVAQSIAGVDFVGCNTYGQIVRVDGQFSGFHNCTAVTCLFP